MPRRVLGRWAPTPRPSFHPRDIARPLGLAWDFPAEQWDRLLDYLAGPGVAPALVPAGRLDGLALRAVDAPFEIGARDDAKIEGPAEALAMAVTGRRHALDDLTGAGTRLLRERLG